MYLYKVCEYSYKSIKAPKYSMNYTNSSGKPYVLVFSLGVKTPILEAKCVKIIDKMHGFDFYRQFKPSKLPSLLSF